MDTGSGRPRPEMLSLSLAALRRRLGQGSFARNVATLVGGVAFAHLVSLLASPALTRIYSPVDFGLVALYGAVITLLASAGSLRYEQAIPIAEEEDGAVNLLALCLLLRLLAALLAALLVLLVGEALVTGTKLAPLRPYLWLVPLGILLSGWYSSFSFWAIRRKAFDRLARTRVQQSLGGTLTSLGLGLLGLKPLGLLLGTLVNQSAGAGNLTLLAWRRDRAALAAIGRRGLVQAALRFKRFPLFSAPTTLLNALSAQLPLLLLGTFFLPEVVGQYALGFRVLTMPSAFLGTSLSQVFLQRATEARRTGDVARITLALFHRLLAAGLTPVLLLTISGPELFAVVFGRQWLEAGRYLQWLGPWVLLVLISSPMSQLFTILEKLGPFFVFNVVLLLTRFASLAVGGLLGDPLLAIALYGVTGALAWLLLCGWILRLAGAGLGVAVRLAGRELLFALPFGLFVVLARLIVAEPLPVTLATALALLVFAACRARQVLRGEWL
ncbi:MAG: lipopolysaccharide biosynthesis protein [Deltaproteobacteria bacterium]|nr:lipopolysaccharide biosynthesis protein [Deltaproteobacteria bacterium]